MKDDNNILLCTLGGSWFIIPEIFHFVRIKADSFYEKHALVNKFKYEININTIPPVQKLWIVTSDGGSINKEISNLLSWWKSLSLQNCELKIFKVKNTKELTSFQENKLMEEAIYRVAYYAWNKISSSDGKLLFALAGGRKTMSAVLQKAGSLFKSDFLFHVVSDGAVEKYMNKEKNMNAVDIYSTIKTNPDLLNGIYPFLFEKMDFDSEGSLIALLNEEEKQRLLKIHKEKVLTDSENVFLIDASNPEFTRIIQSKLKESRDIVKNFFANLIRDEKYENFRSLYRLPRQKIEALRNEKIGFDNAKKGEDLKWLKSLPKAELHFHFGGAATPELLKDIADVNLKHISRAEIEKIRSYKGFCQLLKLVEADKIDEIRKKYSINFNLKELTDYLKKTADTADTEKYKIFSIFLSMIKPASIHKLIYGNDTDYFRNIGLTNYLSLGDLGGSAILQTKEAIEKNVEYIYRYAVSENIRYMEVRCSPAKYTEGGLKITEVIDIIRNAFANNYLKQKTSKRCEVNLIFIATRHGSQLEQDIEPARIIMEQNEDYKKGMPSLVGYDLAGDESFNVDVKDIREKFKHLFKNCLKFTIHAGENAPSERIWEAIYELNADRIGHGLSLYENQKLMSYIGDRGITLELCPSSNYQTSNFRNFCIKGDDDSFKVYPLKEYFNKGISVTINTDNTGISNTTLSNEYLMAAKMTEGGISKWDVLQLIKSSFKNSFSPYSYLSEMLKEVDREVYALLS